jgi:heme oxygenase
VQDNSPEPLNLSVIEALRRATRSRHARLAASPAMMRLFAPDYTALEYRTHLGRLLGLFEPLEKAAADASATRHLVPLLQRSSDLRDDLRSMGATNEEIDALERCSRLPHLQPPGLSGYIYVVLGSMLGGQIIVKQLRAILGAGASYRFYGDEEGRHQTAWGSFCSRLEEHGKEDVKAICATAVEVFDTYADWLSTPPQQSGDR